MQALNLLAEGRPRVLAAAIVFRGRRPCVHENLLMRSFPRLAYFFALIALTAAGGRAQQPADLRILRIATVDTSFNREVLPHRSHDRIRLRVDFEVTGGTAGPFDIAAVLDNFEIRQHFDSYEAGRHARLYTFPVAIEANPAASVTLDPDRTSGDPDRRNNYLAWRLRVLPDPSHPAIQRVETQSYALDEKFEFRFAPRYVGERVKIGTTQLRTTATVEPQPAGAPEDGPEVAELSATVGPDGWAAVERRTLLKLSNVRINPEKLERVTWAAVDADPLRAKFTKMSAGLDGDSERVQRYVTEVLGADYRGRMTPFSAAKRLFRALKGTLSYKLTDCCVPSKILEMGAGQCASGNRLYCGLLRGIGIPARTLGGFYEGQSGQGHEGHRISEFHLPGAGWVPCDATPDPKPRPGGTLAGFGTLDSTNRLWVTWTDDSVYECGFAPHVVSGPRPRERRTSFSLQKSAP